MTANLPTDEHQPDQLFVDLCDYISDHEIESDAAYETARLCLMDSLACALMALDYPACTQLLGPVVPEAQLPGGVRVPGTNFELDPVTAAFNIGSMVRWLDYNDTWLALEWGHPSDNLGAILACADYVSRGTNAIRGAQNAPKLVMRDVLTAMIKAYEIQGVLALGNAFNRVGLDHVLLVRVASTAVATALLGGTKQQIVNALSNAWIDGGALRTYRHAPNTGSRKSWAAGDATSRAVRLALISLTGEMGYPSALSAKNWGFCDVLFNAKPIELAQALDSFVMENILFKVSYPAEFHAQTAVESAVKLHPVVHDRLHDIKCIRIETQEAAMRIIDKTGPLHTPADRDHCIQYIVAVALVHGTLNADHYEDKAASDPQIDRLRNCTEVVENPTYSRVYLEPQKRAIANAVQISFTDGSETERIEVTYPIGHRRRRAEALPLLKRKFESSLSTRFDGQQKKAIHHVFENATSLDDMPIQDFMDLFWKR